MTEPCTLAAAIKQAIQTEKDVMDFYLRAAEITHTERGKRVFATLAREEREHASHFFHIYPGNDLGSFEAFMARPATGDIPLHQQLEKCLQEQGTERMAMEIALKEEQALEQKLRATAAHIADARIKAVFEKMAEETNHHYQIIESECAHIMGMVHETDIDTYVRE